MRPILCTVVLLLALAAPARADETLRIRTQLSSVLELLRARDVADLPPATRDRRTAALASLARYIARGEFPIRTDDAYAGRRPRFIDARGVHCAVGHLIADSGAPELARAINASHEYDYVRDIHEPELLAWANAYGFTVDELAMIQPSYSSPATPGSIRNEIERSVEHITLTCAANHPPPAKLTIRVVGDDDGAANVTAMIDDPFARCFATAASQLERGHGAFDSEPEPYSFTMKVAIPNPQDVLVKRILAMSMTSDCVPRPGPLPRSATIDVRTSPRGIAVKIATTPHNAEITACLERDLAGRLHGFGPGVWKLAVRRERELPPRMEANRIKELLAMHGSSFATDCATGPNPPKRLTITATANTDDEKLVITVDAKDEAFARCFIPKLSGSIHKELTVPREVNGTYQRYFRVDADVRTSATINVEFPAARDARSKRMREEMERRKYDY